MLMVLSRRIELRLNVLLLLLVLLAVVLLHLGSGGLVLRSDVHALGLLLLLARLLLALLGTGSLGIELSYHRRDLSLLGLLPLLLGALTDLGWRRLVPQLDIITMTLRYTLTAGATITITSLAILHSSSIDVLSDVGLLEVLGGSTRQG